MLLYRCGFAAQKTEYYAERRKDGKLLGTFPSKGIAAYAAEEMGGKSVVALRRRRIPEPFSFAAHTVKVQIQSILDTTGASEYCLYLSPRDRDIFRYKIAKTLPYKGNRTAEKPLHYEKLRDYMEKHHPFKCVPGIEADDAMGIDQNKDTIICSIDKDMLQIPGSHYNFVTKELKEITEFGHLELSDNNKKLSGGGLMWFYAQMLLGDVADNIKGISGVGPVATYDLLKDCVTEESLHHRVMGVYQEEVLSLPWDNDNCRFAENADLLWILRNKGETYSSRELDFETK